MGRWGQRLSDYATGTLKAGPGEYSPAIASDCHGVLQHSHPGDQEIFSHDGQAVLLGQTPDSFRGNRDSIGLKMTRYQIYYRTMQIKS